MTNPLHFSPQKALEVITALEQAVVLGAAPFLSVAAEACGLDPELIAQWYQSGRTGEGRCVTFYRAVARKQADWKTGAQHKIMTATKEDAQAMRGVQYLLTCLDREVFGLKQTTAKPVPPTPQAPMGLGEALGTLEDEA